MQKRKLYNVTDTGDVIYDISRVICQQYSIMLRRFCHSVTLGQYISDAGYKKTKTLKQPIDSQPASPKASI